MALSSVQNILHLLDQLESIRANISHELQQIKHDHEGLLEQLGQHRTYAETFVADLYREPMTIDSTYGAACPAALALFPTVPSTNSYDNAPKFDSMTSISYPYFDGPRATAQTVGLPTLASEATFIARSWYKDDEDDHSPQEEGGCMSCGGRGCSLCNDTQTPLALAVNDSDGKVLVLDEEYSDMPKMNTPRIHCQSTLSIELWPVWTEGVSLEKTMMLQSASLSNEKAHRNAGARPSLRAGDEIRGNCLLNSIVLRPSSRCRLLWDMLSIALVGYDAAVLPLYPFDLPEADFMRYMTIITTAFWTADLYMSFTTGFHENLLGFLEMRLTVIVKRYLRTWFLLDIFALSIDYTYILLVHTDGAMEFLSFARAGKTLKIVRLLRMFRLLRAMKGLSIMGGLPGAIFSETTATIFAVAKLILGIILANHFLACGWYAIGTHDLDTRASTWVQKLKERDNSESSFAWFYVSALHWSITQLTPASMEIVPCNTLERCYALCVILIALVAFSSFISSITGSMTHLRTINKESSRQNKITREYITQNKLSLDLGYRIQVFCRKSRSYEKHKKRVHEVDIQAFKVMPVALQQELRVQVFLPIIDAHPFFHLLTHCDEGSVVEICHTAMFEQSCPCGAMLFKIGDLCNRMLFILNGEFEYLLQADTTPTTYLHDRDHVGEIGLWIQWAHQGRLVASTSCEVVWADSGKFRAVAQRLEAYDSCKRYAQAFANSLKDSCHTDSDTLCDMFNAPNGVLEQAFEAQYQPEGGRNVAHLGLFQRFFSGRSISSLDGGIRLMSSKSRRLSYVLRSND